MASTRKSLGQEFHCPMHPEVRQNGPGTCPKCDMALEPVAAAKEAPANGPAVKALRHNMFAMGHERSTWIQIPIFFLGAWLVASPLFAQYSRTELAISDVASGLVLLVLAYLGLHPKRYWTDLAATAIGLWLLFAPLVFWAATPYEYANDTIVGALVVIFAIVLPMSMPMGGGDVPKGWTYNPSTWQQRAPIVILGLASFVLARHLAAFQLGHVDWVYEPFFGNGSQQVLHSNVSKWWPVSDAGLGALVYLVELLSTVMGDEKRWRTMPWMVAIFGFAVIPLGITSIVLVILQPVMVSAWCTICLLTALLMLLMIPLALDEVVAMVQFLAAAKREGLPLWRTFFLGGDATDARISSEVRPRYWSPRSMFWGITVPWHLVVVATAGIAVMAIPGLLGASGPSANNSFVVGALVTTVALIAVADVARPVQWLNVPMGAWLAVAAVLLPDATWPAKAAMAAIGALVAFLSLRRFRVHEHYGTLDRFVARASKRT